MGSSAPNHNRSITPHSTNDAGPAANTASLAGPHRLLATSLGAGVASRCMLPRYCSDHAEANVLQKAWKSTFQHEMSWGGMRPSCYFPLQAWDVCRLLQLLEGTRRLWSTTNILPLAINVLSNVMVEGPLCKGL